MGRQQSRGSAERFASYLEGLAGVIGHAGRVGPLSASARDSCARWRQCVGSSSIRIPSMWVNTPSLGRFRDAIYVKILILIVSSCVFRRTLPGARTLRRLPASPDAQAGQTSRRPLF
jgi:hypothetical protein